MDLVLEPRDTNLLEGLRLNPRKRFAGRVRGERTTQTRGVSIEFADFREYAEGDDLRHLDWNVLARLGHPVTKTYRDEEDLAVHLLLDCSHSMSFGSPSKWETAQSLAAALGFVALTAGDALFPRWLGVRKPPPAVIRGRSGYHRLASWLGSVQPEGTSPIDDDVKAFAGSGARTGLVVLVTDALQPGMTSSLRLLAGRGHEVWLIQVLSETELNPDLEGDLRLLDSESSSIAEVTINSFTLSEYRSNLDEHNTLLRDEVNRTGGKSALIVSGTPLAEVAKNVWRRERWLE